MWIALGLMLPLALYVIVAAFDSRSTRDGAGHQYFPAAVVIAAALWCAVAVSTLLVVKNRWPRTTQIAWTGVERRLSAIATDLSVGGNQQDAVIGWPNGLFSPLLRIVPRDDRNVELQIEKDGAFVTRKADHALLNGQLLREGETRVFDGYRFELKPAVAMPWALGVLAGLLLILWVLTKVFDWKIAPSLWIAAVVVAVAIGIWVGRTRAFALQVFTPERDLVLSMQLPRPVTGHSIDALDNLSSRSRARSEDVKRNAMYDDWSRSVLIALTADGLRVLTRSDKTTATCALPCELTLEWRRLRLDAVAEVLRPRNSIRVSFERPWRRTSPLPPMTTRGRQIVITRDPRPGDYAFVLPMGGGARDARTTLRIAEEDGVPRFSSAPRPDRSVYAESRRRSVVTSSIFVVASDYSILLATAVDVLHIGAAITEVAIALTLLIAGVIIASLRIKRTNQWWIYGLPLVCFGMLLFRLALSIRYAAAPESLDRLAVKGVVLAVVALITIPGALLTVALLRSAPSGRSRATWWPAPAYLFAVIGTGLLETRAAGSIWPGLPALVAPSRQFILTTAVVLGVFAIYGAIGTLLPQSLTVVSYEKFTKWADSFWQASLRPVRRGWWWYVRIALFAVLALLLLLGPSKVRFTQEVFTPVVLTVTFALLWLTAGAINVDGAHNARSARSRFSFWSTVAFWSALTVLVPVFIIPIAVRDPGSMLATLAVFVPVCLFLWAADRGQYARAAVTCSLGLAVALALVSYLRYEEVYPTIAKWKFTGNVPARILTFKRAERAQEDVLRTSQSLEQAYQHTWENKAIAHQGQWNGLGFGAAPTRRSHVTQDTLQFDSVFSFFVFSEHGAVGAMSLLIIYALPLVLVLGGRRSIRVSDAFALVIAAAFLGEAWFHAAMNLNIWPFAGRNLPLLSVNSGTDLLKWFLLFAAAITTPFWGATARQRADAVPEFVSASRRWALGACAGGFAIILLALVAVAAIRVVRDSRLDKPLSWDDMLASVQALSRTGDLTLDENTYRIKLAPDQAAEGSLLARQVEAFNQVPVEQRLGTQPMSQLLGRLFSVSDVDSYTAVLRDEARVELDKPRPRPFLFTLQPLAKCADEDCLVPVVGSYRIAPNPDFNARTTFHEPRGPESMPKLFISEQQIGAFVLQGNGFEITIPRRPPKPYEMRFVQLAKLGNDLSLRSDSDAASARGEVSLANVSTKTRHPVPFIRFDVTPQLNLFVDNPPRGFTLRVRRAGSEISVYPGRRVQLLAGDRVSLALPIAVDPSFSVAELDPPPLVGPAWVMGRWITAIDETAQLPWTPYLVNALESEWERLGPVEAAKRYRYLTLDLGLQSAAQATVARHGRDLHQSRLDRLPRLRSQIHGAVSAAALETIAEAAHPPRVALTAITLPDGAIIAQAGWPTMKPGPIGGPCTVVDRWCPPSSWLDREAPGFVRARYGGDRNFDRIEMGSSTKPILAAAALAVQPGLDRQLHVTGPAGEEDEVFGIHIPAKKGWHILHGEPPWLGFTDYLRISDNRYQVRLGFLALAERDHGAPATDGRSPSDRESMDGARAWQHYPRWPSRMLFGKNRPGDMQRIDDSPFARALQTMFSVGVHEGDVRPRRLSYWTANGNDDAPTPAAATPEESLLAMPPISHNFDAISPEAPALAFDYISNPRQYVSLLLGGNENRWSNVDFAAGFATAVTGRALVPHIVKLSSAAIPLNGRTTFPEIAHHLRPGLARVVTDGTAASQRANLLPPAIAAIPGVVIYAKTGTLAVASDAQTTTSRLVVALIRWADESQGIVNKGVVLSLVAQEAQQGDATNWLGAFVSEHQEEIALYLR